MPLVFMGTIGVAYAYNMGGINYLLGRDVSYVTNAVASAMQLGVTMDYCIFYFTHSKPSARSMTLKKPWCGR